MKKILYLTTILFVFLSIPAILEITGFYVINDPIESKNLLVEGWLDNKYLENAPFNFEDFDSIFVVGIRTNPQWYKVKKFRKGYFTERLITEIGC
jgi:hypothetical protein